MNDLEWKCRGSGFNCWNCKKKNNCKDYIYNEHMEEQNNVKKELVMRIINKQITFNNNEYMITLDGWIITVYDKDRKELYHGHILNGSTLKKQIENTMLYILSEGRYTDYEYYMEVVNWDGVIK